MDNIGGSVNFEEEVCVQKNNLWREKGTKHIPCGYRSLFNFNMDSVYAPDGWVLTDEEKHTVCLLTHQMGCNYICTGRCW